MKSNTIYRYRNGENSHYLPGLLLSCSTNALPAQTPFVHSLKGGMLFVDVSGFSALTEKVSREGHYGVEIITGLLNGYFELVEELLQIYGGEIFKFAGDAFLALFVGEKVPARQAMAAFIQALKIRLQELNKQFKKIYGEEISFHGSASWGAFKVVVIGDPQHHYDYFLYGSSVERFFAEDLPGGHNYICGLPKPKPDSFVVKHKRCKAQLDPQLFLPLELRAAKDTGKFFSELRNLAILFIHADLSGIPARRKLSEINKLFCHLQEAIYRYEGVVNKSDYNEKGLSFLCTFGYPISHINDIERAIIAARKILEYPVSGIFRIGITYNNVFTGILGASKRFEYGIIGSAVNAACRLMEEAKVDQIVVSQNILSSLEVRFECKYLQDARVKGFDEPIKMYQIQRELPLSYHSFSKLFKDQIIVSGGEQISAIIARLKEPSKYSKLYISGEPGTGKSFLIWNIIKELKDSCKISMISLDEHNQSEPYYLIHSFVRQHLDSLPILENESALAAFVADSGEIFNTRLIISYFNAEEKQYKTDQDLAQEQELIYDQLKKLALYLFSKTDILILDNIHWLDKASLRLLSELSESLPLNIILSARYGYYQDRFAAFQHFILKNLDLEQTTALVSNEIGVIAQDAIEHLHQITSGNPLFLVEMCRATKKHYQAPLRLITISDLKLLVGKGILPNSIESLLINRFSAFDADSRYLLKLAAIIGRAFSFDLIASIESSNIKFKIIELLFKLDQHNVINKIDINPDLIYIFSNNLMRESIYNTILRSEKRSLHETIADHYVLQMDADSKENLEIIANHYVLAEKAGKAIKYCQLAAEKNFALANYEESSFFYSNALKFCKSAKKRQELELALVDSLFYHLELERAEKTLSEMPPPKAKSAAFSKYIYLKTKALYLKTELKELERLILQNLDNFHPDHYYLLSLVFYADTLRTINKIEELQKVLYKIRQQIQQQIDKYAPLPVPYLTQNFQDLLPLMDKIISIPQLKESLYYINKIEGISGQLAFDQGDFQQASRHYKNQLYLARKLGDDIAVRIALNSLGNIQLRWGKHKLALNYYKKAKRIAEKGGDRYGYLKVIQDMAILHRQSGDFERALEDYRTSYDMALAMGNKTQQEVALYNIGEVYFHQGELEKAEKYIKESLELALEISDMVGISFARDALGDILINQGKLEEAEQYYRANLLHQRRINDRVGMAHTIGNLGNIAMDKDNYPLALRHFKQYHKLSLQSGEQDGANRALASIGFCLIHEEDYEEALAYLQQAQAGFAEINISTYAELLAEQIEICKEALRTR
ncbi:MAG: tetratricopeptide repeat protein [Candidatus Cloacimonetes bacterium]|nr:tetratricopeptide repeat protein [Candidatus Cloacimonadota bacterium]